MQTVERQWWNGHIPYGRRRGNELIFRLLLAAVQVNSIFTIKLTTYSLWVARISLSLMMFLSFKSFFNFFGRGLQRKPSEAVEWLPLTVPSYFKKVSSLYFVSDLSKSVFLGGFFKIYSSAQALIGNFSPGGLGEVSRKAWSFWTNKRQYIKLKKASVGAALLGWLSLYQILFIFFTYLKKFGFPGEPLRPLASWKTAFEPNDP